MDYGALLTEIVKAMATQGLQACDKLATKTIQLYVTFMVRIGVMLVGPTLGGKTTDYKCLSMALTALREQDHEEENYKKTMFTCFSEEEEAANRFRQGFKTFFEGFSENIGVCPTQTMGRGRRDLVWILDKKQETIFYLAHVVTTEGQAPPDNAPFLLTCIRALRDFIYGVGSNGKCWEAYLASTAPDDPELPQRQQAASDAGVVGAVAGGLSHSNTNMVKEALLTLQIALSRSGDEPCYAAHQVLEEYVADDSRRRTFVASCVELLVRSVRDLRDREKLLQKRREERQAQRRANKRRVTDDNDGTESVGSQSESVGSADTETALKEEDDDGEVDKDMPQLVESGHPLELLTMLVFSLQSGSDKIQDVLYSWRC